MEGDDKKLDPAGDAAIRITTRATKAKCKHKASKTDSGCNCLDEALAVFSSASLFIHVFEAEQFAPLELCLFKHEASVRLREMVLVHWGKARET